MPEQDSRSPGRADGKPFDPRLLVTHQKFKERPFPCGAAKPAHTWWVSNCLGQSPDARPSHAPHRADPETQRDITRSLQFCCSDRGWPAPPSAPTSIGEWLSCCCSKDFAWSQASDSFVFQPHFGPRKCQWPLIEWARTCFYIFADIKICRRSRAARLMRSGAPAQVYGSLGRWIAMKLRGRA